MVIGRLSEVAAESQNALLHMLEEPVPGNIYILAADSMGGVLPTIRSRATAIQLRRPSFDDMKLYYGSEYDDAKLKLALSAARTVPDIDLYLKGENET